MQTTPPRATVVIGFFGATLDAGRGRGRWNRWRPTVSLFQQPDLIVDRLELLCARAHDTADMIEDIGRLSPETEIVCHPFDLTDPWDFEEVYEALHRFVRDRPFDRERERYLVHLTTGTHVAQICLFLLTETGFIPGNLIQTGPPTRHTPTPTYQIVDLDLARYERIAQRFEAERRDRASRLKGGIVTRNAAFNALVDQLERVAVASRAPLLLTGATGTGKTELARRVFELKRDRDLVSGPLVEVNCATLRGDTAMSTLFGHVRGAFTGAQTLREGILRRAHRGVVFLDEIGDLGLDEQAMLLTAIEDKRFYPMGAEQAVESDFQLIAGTHRDLDAAVAAGRFREDLLARINTWSFRLPSLVDRSEDIAPNLDFELERASRVSGTRVTMAEDARAHFLAFAVSPGARWRANFRDLGAAVTRMATLATNGRVRLGEVRAEVERLETSWAPRATTPTAGRGDRVRQALGEAADAVDLFDRAQLEAVLEVCARSRSLSEAGRELFAESRKRRTSVNDADRLRKYLARFGLSWGALPAMR